MNSYLYCQPLTTILPSSFSHANIHCGSWKIGSVDVVVIVLFTQLFTTPICPILQLYPLPTKISSICVFGRSFLPLAADRVSHVMANLKNDLDEYLLLQSDQKKSNAGGGSFKLDMMKMPSLKVSTVKNLFGKSEPVAANGWLKDTQESCCPKLSRLQRIVGFVLCICMGIFCMTLSTLYIPVLILKARKFALLFSLGSLFFIMR